MNVFRSLLILSSLLTAACLAAETSMLPEGSFEKPTGSSDWPAGWGKPKSGGSWEQENGNHFVRLTSNTPGEMVMMYQPVKLSAEMKALELTWRMRVTGLQKGKQAWFDARILIDFKDKSGNKLAGGLAPNAGKDTEGWVDRKVAFLVPAGAAQLEVMPALFQVNRGKFDLDDVVLKSIDPKPLLAERQALAEKSLAKVPVISPEREKWPKELHVAGNKVLNSDNKAVMLRGVNVVSLEWSARGEQVTKAAEVAIDEWHANIIRLPVTEEFWNGKGAQDQGAGYQRIVDNMVNLAANRGAYLMLDLHRFKAPTAAHIAFWKEAAARYKNHPAVIFDLFNEPHGTTWEVWRNGGFVAESAKPGDEANFTKANTKGINAVGMQALVDAVRGSGAKNVILVGGLDYAYDLSGMAQGFVPDEKGGNGMILSTHIYPWKKAWMEKVMVMAKQYPILVGEFGANTQKMTWLKPEWQEDAATWVPAMLGFIQQNELHWTAFCFHPKSAPHLLSGWDFQPTPEWGAFVKRALSGEKFTVDRPR